MRIFVAGATGAVGTSLVPMLLAGGHEVVAMTRSLGKADGLRRQGATPVVADALDRGAVVQAIVDARPDLVVHELTALGGRTDIRHFDSSLAATNRLRTGGTDHLMEGARAAGVRRIVAQSYGSWTYGGAGRGLKSEDDGLDPTPPRKQRETVAAIRHLERAVLSTEGIQGVVLRYGNFYGSGTGFAPDGEVVEMVRRRRLPIVGDGGGVWSFVHIDDVASATVAAIDRGTSGVYNVVDDDPAPVSVWLPELARVLGAKPPRHVPEWVGRLVIGEVGVSIMTRIRGASNAKIGRELGWRPGHLSWRDGFRQSLSLRTAA
jgi:nucleoside-diphosphate-sugar epimerase